MTESKPSGQLFLECTEKLGVVAGEEKIVHIHEEVSENSMSMIDKQRHIRVSLSKPTLYKERTQLVVPRARGLAKPVDSLAQLTHVIRELGIPKSRRLSHANLFMKWTLKECIVDIELMDRPVMREGNDEYCADCDRLENGTEGLVEVNSWPLVKSLGDETSFE
ncbi:unnamed protein product [Linum trigynum]|uniref:Uncharacterized protein n=1 Tax=Linum trigynum TaxID=586398 RepID=A0AAV2GXE3_9ROSI